MKKFKLKVTKVGNKTVEHCECEKAICDTTFIRNLKGLSEYNGMRFHKKSIIESLTIPCARIEVEKET